MSRHHIISSTERPNALNTKTNINDKFGENNTDKQIDFFLKLE